MFEPSHLMNGLESICHILSINVDLVRGFSKRVTRDQVKKMEFLERAGSKDSTKALLALLSGSNGKYVEAEEEDDDADE